MSDTEMMEETSELYVRNLKDVKNIIKHAKLDERNLTKVTQALYYPSADTVSENLKLLELDDHMLQHIQAGDKLCFKGGLNEKIVLCTEERTYDVKAAEISNSLLLVPELKFAAETSTSPLKSPRTGNVSLERSVNDSIEDDDDVGVERTLDHRPVLNIFHEYFECREIQPKFRKIGDLLQLTRYSGPENEEFIDKKLLFTYEQLHDTVQCSSKQFLDGLMLYRVIEFDGYMRILEYEYEYRILNIMVSLISENSWALDEIDRDITLESLNGISPRDIVDSLFDLYTIQTDGKDNKFTYKEEWVARIVAQNILQPGLKFRLDEFMSTWQDALPDGMKCEEKYLRALGIFDKEGGISCIRSLAEERLPISLQERLKILFKTKNKWTLDEMEPYIQCFTTPTQSVSTLMAKYARSLTEGGTRYYVSKH